MNLEKNKKTIIIAVIGIAVFFIIAYSYATFGKEKQASVTRISSPKIDVEKTKKQYKRKIDLAREGAKKQSPRIPKSPYSDVEDPAKKTADTLGEKIEVQEVLLLKPETIPVTHAQKRKPPVKRKIVKKPVVLSSEDSLRNLNMELDSLRRNAISRHQEKQRLEKKEIKIAIRGDQKIKNGQRLKLKTMEDLSVGNVTIPKYTPFVGVVRFSEYRANVTVQSMVVNNKIIPVDFNVYGLDGLLGIPINSDKVLEATKNSTVDDAISEVPSKIPLSNTLGKLVSGKNREAKVHMIDGAKLYLVEKKK